MIVNVPYILLLTRSTNIRSVLSKTLSICLASVSVAELDDQKYKASQLLLIDKPTVNEVTYKLEDRDRLHSSYDSFGTSNS